MRSQLCQCHNHQDRGLITQCPCVQCTGTAGAGLVTHWCQLPAQCSWSLLTDGLWWLLCVLSSDPSRTLGDTEHCDSAALYTLVSTRTQPTFLAFLLRVGPSGDSGSGGPLRLRSWLSELFTENDVNTDTRSDTRDRGLQRPGWCPGAQSVPSNVLTQTGGMWDWQHTSSRHAALVTSHPARDKSSELRKPRRAESSVITGSWEQLRTGSTGLCCPACAAL